MRCGSWKQAWDGSKVDRLLRETRVFPVRDLKANVHSHLHTRAKPGKHFDPSTQQRRVRSKIITNTNATKVWWPLFMSVGWGGVWQSEKLRGTQHRQGGQKDSITCSNREYGIRDNTALKQLPGLKKKGMGSILLSGSKFHKSFCYLWPEKILVHWPQRVGFEFPNVTIHLPSRPLKVFMWVGICVCMLVCESA